MEKCVCRWGNTENQWGGVSRFIHWLSVMLILGLLIVGFYMASLTDSQADMAVKGPLIFIHKSMGVLFLGVLIFRFIWRRMTIIPTIPPTSFHLLSKMSAPVLYLSMLSMPLSGLLMSQAAGYPVSFFGLFTLPTVLSKSEEWAKILHDVHEYSAYTLIALIIIHTGAAFYHHYVLKDQVFLRMLKNINVTK